MGGEVVGKHISRTAFPFRPHSLHNRRHEIRTCHRKLNFGRPDRAGTACDCRPAVGAGLGGKPGHVARCVPESWAGHGRAVARPSLDHSQSRARPSIRWRSRRGIGRGNLGGPYENFAQHPGSSRAGLCISFARLGAVSSDSSIATESADEGLRGSRSVTSILRSNQGAVQCLTLVH